MFERQLIFLEAVLSIVNPVNKLYSPAYKVQQPFFVPAIKTCLLSIMGIETYFIY